MIYFTNIDPTLVATLAGDTTTINSVVEEVDVETDFEGGSGGGSGCVIA